MAIIAQQTPDGGTELFDTSTGRPYVAPVSRQSYSYDTAPYQDFLKYAANRYTLPGADRWDADTLSNVAGAGATPDDVFNFNYSGRYANVNPYYTTKIRDQLRDVATKIGLKPEDADKAALDVANTQYKAHGQPYSEATHPAIIADEIAQKIFAQAGKPYQPMNAEQYAKFNSDAGGWQQHAKEHDKSDWERDDIGGSLAFIGQVMQDRWEALLNDPERSATPGPISTWIQNKVLNKDNDPITDIWGGATKHDFEEAGKAGIETGGAQAIQWLVENLAGLYGGQALGAGFEGAGLTASQAAAASAAVKGGAGAMAGNAGVEDVLKGALGGAVKSGLLNNLGGGDSTGSKGSGDLYASNDTGTLTDAAPDAGTSAGTTGGSMWNEDGEWIGDPNEYQDPNADAYNDPYYDGSGVDTTGSGPTGGSDPSIWSSVAGLGSGLSGILKGIFGGGGSGGTGTGTGTDTDTGGFNLAKLLGSLGATGLGMAGSKNLSNKYDSMAKRYEGFGEDYRNRLAETYRDPNGWLNSAEVQGPVQQGTNALARSLSVKGNPAGSPAALQEIQNYATTGFADRLGKERDRLAGFGALQPLQLAAPGAASKAADAGAGVYNAAGAGVADLTNPQPTLMDFLKQLKTAGFA